MKQKEMHIKGLERVSENMGMTVPTDYFSHSKSEILSSLKTEVKQKKVSKTRFMVASIAASVVIIIALGVNYRTNNLSTSLDYVSSNDLALNCLLLEDDVLDSYIDESIVVNTYDEILSDVGEGEELLLNSLFVDDENLDSYIDEYYESI